MTKYGVISDIHGNFPALNEVYKTLMVEHDVDEVVCCGDVVGILGWPLHTVHKIDGVCEHVVCGNHDARVRDDFGDRPEFPAADDEAKLVNENLTDGALELVNSWPQRVETDDFIMGHSWPQRTIDPEESLTGQVKHDLGVEPRHAPRAGKYADGKYVFLGHTHRQFEQSVDKFQGQSGHIVNPGSVGVPWHEPAEYAVVDTKTDDVLLESVEYDTDCVEEQFDYWNEKIGLKTW